MEIKIYLRKSKKVRDIFCLIAKKPGDMILNYLFTLFFLGPFGPAFQVWIFSYQQSLYYQQLVRDYFLEKYFTPAIFLKSES